MFAKEPVAARDDESSPQLRELRGLVGTQSEVGGAFEAFPSSNVVPLRRGEAGPEDLEERLQDAFDRALAEPLAAAKAIAAELTRRVDDAQTSQMRVLADSLTSVEDHVRDLLEFVASSFAGGLRIARRRVDLKLLCERVIDVMQREHPEHVIVFKCESRVHGEWDPDRIASLISRLVKNAIQYGLSPRVVVGLQGRADDAVLEVHGNGPPLDDAVVRGSFQPFMRGRPPRSGGAAGLGLGLYLSREIVRAHAGQLDANSDSGGTTFRITLPRSYAGAQARD
jgi:phosphoserine phosphatase RsbU/P